MSKKIGEDTYKTIPDSLCPNCGASLDAATNFDPKYKGSPKKGDCSTCAECASLLVFNKDLTLHIMTDDERLAFLTKNPEGYTRLMKIIEFLQTRK